jgi:hypothetical protein
MSASIANFASCLGKYDATLSGSAVLDISGTTGNSDLSMNAGYLTNTTGFVMPSASNGNGISFSGWFNPNGAEPSSYTPIFDISCSPTQSITLCVSGNSLTPALVGNFIGNQVYQATGISANTWNFFTYTICCSGASTLVQNLYVNNNTVSVTGGTYTALTFMSSTVGYGSGIFANYFNGKIDDFRYYGRVITPMEVRVLNTYAYGKSTVSTLVPSLGTITYTAGLPTNIPFVFSNTGTYSYLQYKRIGNNGTASTGTLSPSTMVTSGQSYTWSDTNVVPAVTYLYTWTPYILGTPGLSSGVQSIYTLAPASAFTGFSATSISSTGFTLSWTGGVGTSISYLYYINNIPITANYTGSGATQTLTFSALTVTTSGTTPTAYAWYVDICANNLAGTTHGIYTVYAPPTAVYVTGTYLTATTFSLVISGGLANGTTTYTYNIGAGTGVGYTTSSNTSLTPIVTVTNSSVNPWTVTVTATANGLSTTSSSISVEAFPLPIIWYKFNNGDQVGQNLYNWATGLYDASLTATGLISTSQFSTGNASIYLNGSNYITINQTILSTYSLANSAGFNNSGGAYGWYPNNAYGYTVTCWAYNNSGTDGWGAGIISWLQSSSWTVGLIPQDRLAFGISNYSPPGAWGAIAYNTWMFFALVFPVGSTNASIAPTLYVYGNNNTSVYYVTPQVSSAGDLALPSPGAPYTQLYIGYNGNTMYSQRYKGFTGYLDDFRFFPMALTSTQINSIYNKTA